MAVSMAVQPLPPVNTELDDILRELARDYSKENLKDDIEFTKRTLGGNFLKLPEDDIAPFLKELRKQGRITPRKTGYLEFYAKDNKSIEEKIKRLKSQSMKGREKESEFIGREDDVRAVVDHLTRETTMIMTLHGDPGVGKTTLAEEVVNLLISQGKVTSTRKVDMRNMKNQKEFCFAFLDALKSEKGRLQPCMEFVYEAIENLKKRTILILDNAEDMLSQPSLQESQVSLAQMIKGMQEHNKSNKLVILLTSRIPLPDEIDSSVNCNYRVKPLNEAKSATVLEKSNLLLTPDEKNEIIKLCVNKPLLLKLVAGLMQENLLNAGNIEQLKKVLNALEKPAFASAKEEAVYVNAYDSNIISELFENFMPEMKKATIKLSLFQGLFTFEDAIMMIKQPEIETLVYLNILTAREFLTEKTDNEVIKYEMHPSINKFMLSQFENEDYKDIVTDAKETFFENYLKKSKEIAQLLDKDYVGAYSVIEKERLNLKLAIEISFERGFLYFSSDYSESAILADLFIILIPGLEREKLFREWSMTAEKKGEWISYSILVCMHITVLLEKTAGKSEARNLLGKVKEALSKLNDKSSDTYRLAESSYLYAKGEMLYSDCESKGRDVCRKAEWRKVLDFYQQSLKIREELLKDHTDTARTLNAIGNCYMYLEELEKALEYYTRALEMRKRLSGSQLHVDMPVYINQIGATHELMGKEYQRKAEEANLYYRKEWAEKSHREFNEALKKYQEALDLEKRLHISGYINTAIFYRNMSNTYSFLEDYESSLRNAKKALFVRKKLLGIDSDTIRSYYQVGLAYEKLEEIDKALKYFYKAYMMEQALPEGETSPVRDRVLRKIEANDGSPEEADLEDKRHKVALAKGCLDDDDILTSEDEQEEEEVPPETTVQATDEEPPGTTLQAPDEGPPGTTLQAPDEGPQRTTVPKTNDGPSGTTVQTTNERPSRILVQTTNEGPPVTTQEEKQISYVLADLEIEERLVSDRQVIGKDDLQWSIKETGVCILFLPGTVLSDTSISCHVYKEPEMHLPLEPTESLVSMVVRLDADNPVFDKEIGLLIPHCGAIKTKGYEVAVKEFNNNLGSWEEIDFINIQHKSDLQDIESELTIQQENINLPAVLLTRQNCSTVCVTCRLVKDVLTARPAGSTLVSSVFPEVQLVLEKNTVKKNTSIDMKVHPLPDFTVFNSSSLSCGPVLDLQASQTESIDIHKPVRITLPHPLTWHGNCNEGDAKRGQVRILYNKHSDSSSIEWQDITDNPETNISVNGQKISLQVRHFSMFWPIWISDAKQDIQKLLNKAKEQFAIICRSSPFNVQFRVQCKPRIRKGQAILHYTARPTHLVKASKRDSRFDDADEELYDGEKIQVCLVGQIQPSDSEDSTFYIKFSSKIRKQKSMCVKVEDEDGRFSCRFLRTANDQCICKIPFELPLVPKAIGDLKALEFYGVPLEDPNNKWKLLEAPKDVLQRIISIVRSSLPSCPAPDIIDSLTEVAKEAFGMKSSDEDSIKFFFQRVSHTSMQQVAFDAVIINLTDASEHVKQVLQAGRKVVEGPLDKETAKSLSQYIEEDYIKLAQAADLVAECENVKNMKGTSIDRCYIFLRTWISHQTPTLHLLMQKLREVGCEKGMEALLKEFEDRLDKRIKSEASALKSENTLVKVEGQYQEASTVTPLLASQVIDVESSSEVFEGSHDIVSSAGHCIDDSTTHASPLAEDNDSSISASTTSDADGAFHGEDETSSGDSPDSSRDIIEEQTSVSTSLLYPSVCLVALSLGYIYFRYIRR